MLSRVVIALLTCVPCLAGPAFAQQQVPAQQQPGGQTAVAKQVSPNNAAPLLLQADDLIYDHRNNRVIARGNVEIYQDENVLLADEVIYDRTGNTLTAIGNVRLKEADGSVVNAERLTLRSNFRDGFVRSLRALTQDDTRVAAATAYKKDNQTIYEKGVVTSCKPCEAHPEQPPIWRIKATRIIQDTEEHNIYYENAQFEFYGIPIAWVPYFYTPDNTVQQRSGFMPPSYMYNSATTGYSLAIPYYYAASPNYDLLITPEFTTQAGYLLQTDWRQKLWNGSYEIKLAGAYDQTANDFWGDRNWRGSVESHGDFALNNYWHFGWNGIIESDYTFRRFYSLDSIYATERTSTMYLTGMAGQNYFNISVDRYGNLLGNSYDLSTGTYIKTVNTTAYPSMDYNYIHNKPVFGGELSFDVNAVALSISDPTVALPNVPNVSMATTDHIATDAQWRRTFKDDLGQVYTPFVFVRGDIYNVSNFQEGGNTGPGGTFIGNTGPGGTVTRDLAGVGLDYRYPFIASTDGGTQVIEPVAQIVSRAGEANNKLIPITDAQSLVFDDTNLFSINKFSGYDQIETGTRTNFGVQYSFQANNGLTFRTVAGESIQIAGPNAYSTYVNNPYDPYQNSGLETTRSDYVAGFYLDYKNMFGAIAQLRFDEADMSLADQVYTLQTKLGFLQAGVSFESAEALPYFSLPARQEVSAFGALKLTDQWSIYGDMRYDFELGMFIRNSAGVQYTDECVIYAITYQQTNVQVEDIKPNTSVLVTIGIKGFGQQTAPSSIYDISPEAAAYR